MLVQQLGVVRQQLEEPLPWLMALVLLLLGSRQRGWDSLVVVRV